MRKRFTAPAALVAEAEEYAAADNRSFSELVCEALRQHMRRYPRKCGNGHHGAETATDKAIAEIREQIAWLYTQVHQARKPQGVTD